MKKTLIIIALMAIVSQTFSQTQVKDNDYYLARGTKQKSAARTLLIGGGAAIGLGFLIGDRRNSTFDEAATGFVIGSVGFLSMCGSVPLFIASGKNSKKAKLIISSNTSQLNPEMGGKKFLSAGIAISIK